jgi:hypothetical protein
VFILDLSNLRRPDPFSGQVAMCLMHSASPHVSERLPRSLGHDDVLIVAVPAHTLSIFQALDLVFCSALNSLMAAAEGEFRDDSVSDEITRFVRI